MKEIRYVREGNIVDVRCGEDGELATLFTIFGGKYTPLTGSWTFDDNRFNMLLPLLEKTCRVYDVIADTLSTPEKVEQRENWEVERSINEIMLNDPNVGWMVIELEHALGMELEEIPLGVKRLLLENMLAHLKNGGPPMA